MRISAEEIDGLITHPPLIPTAYHLIIRTEEIDEVSEGGIVMMTKSEAKREKLGAAQGYIIAIGPHAWQELSDGSPWAELGDLVIFDRYAGMVPQVDGFDDGKYRILKDEDVVAVWPK